MIYINLGFVVLSTYLAAIAESRTGIVLNSVAATINVVAVAFHLAQ